MEYIISFKNDYCSFVLTELYQILGSLIILWFKYFKEKICWQFWEIVD